MGHFSQFATNGLNDDPSDDQRFISESELFIQVANRRNPYFFFNVCHLSVVLLRHRASPTTHTLGS